MSNKRYNPTIKTQGVEHVHLPASLNVPSLATVPPCFFGSNFERPFRAVRRRPSAVMRRPISAAMTVVVASP